MLLWTCFANKAYFDEHSRRQWLDCIKNPAQDRLLAMLDSCLKQTNTRHKLWSRADFERLRCSKPFATAIFITDSMVQHHLKGHAASLGLWQTDIVNGWFENHEDAAVLLVRVNKFLRSVQDGIQVVESVVKTQSYVAFLRMSALASALLFAYLHVRQLQDTWSTTMPLHGFCMFVSSSKHIFSLDQDVATRGVMPTVGQGLQCLARLPAEAWEMMGPLRTAKDLCSRTKELSSLSDVQETRSSDSDDAQVEARRSQRSAEVATSPPDTGGENKGQLLSTFCVKYSGLTSTQKLPKGRAEDERARQQAWDVDLEHENREDMPANRYEAQIVLPSESAAANRSEEGANATKEASVVAETLKALHHEVLVCVVTWVSDREAANACVFGVSSNINVSA
jgi:hypothetical protein